MDDVETQANYRKLLMKEFWKVIATKHNLLFLELIKLVAASLVIPVSNVDCERGFSTQNRIKNKLCNRLKTNRLNHLMRITIEGPPIDLFNFTRTFDIWKNDKRRRILSYIITRSVQFMFTLYQYHVCMWPNINIL